MCDTEISASAPASKRDCASPSAFKGFSDVNTSIVERRFTQPPLNDAHPLLVSEDAEGKDILFGFTMPHNKNLAG